MGPRLLALSDLHLNYPSNRETLAALPDHPEDWLILAGDVGDTDEHMRFAFETLGPKFARLLWVPGNHELWTLPGEAGRPRGAALYAHLVELCRRHDVLTPEDPWAVFEGQGGPARVALLFLLYDYSFCPEDVEDARAWAAAVGIAAADERYLFPHPYPDRPAWCQARVEATLPRLEEAAADGPPLVLVNHYPLRYDQVRLGKIPRFSPWCGTRRTEDWHRRFPVEAVVSGHLHGRTTDWRDGVRFEEVSLGAPRHWRRGKGASGYLRQVLPGPAAPPPGAPPGPHFHW